METKTRTLILSALLAFASYFIEPAAPGQVSVVRPTEQSIREGMKHEQLEKQYKRAALAAGMVYRRNGCGQGFAEETGRAAIHYGIPPPVLAAVVFVESSCNPNAVSHTGDIGLTQVHYKVWRQHTREEYFNPTVNLEMGAQILSTYVRTYGLREGLHAYNGLSCPTNEYAEKVLSKAGIN